MASRTDEMVRHLKSLQMNTPDIEASAVVSVDGLIMASQLPADVDEDRVSAMSAAMLSLGDRIANELKRGELDQVFVLTAFALSRANLGLVFLEMKRTANELSNLV